MLAQAVEDAWHLRLRAEGGDDGDKRRAVLVPIGKPVLRHGLLQALLENLSVGPIRIENGLIPNALKVAKKFVQVHVICPRTEDPQCHLFDRKLDQRFVAIEGDVSRQLQGLIFRLARWAATTRRQNTSQIVRCAGNVCRSRAVRPIPFGRIMRLTSWHA
jgi:hypothetical protein